MKSPSGAVASGIGGSIVNIVCSACLIAPVVVALYFAGYYTFDGGRTLVKDLKDFAWDEVRNDREVVLKEMGMGLKEVGLGWKDSLLSSKTAVVLTTAPTVSTATKRLLRIIPTPER